MEPLVSVIVPIYNGERFLEECIESILNQSYKNVQLVLVDDCSSDRSCYICAKYLNNNVKLIKHNAREGVSKTRNDGIVHAKGMYVCFVDADDVLEKDYIFIYVKLIQRNNVEAVFGKYKYLNKKKKIKRPSRIKSGLYSMDETSSILIDDGTITGIMLGSACTAIYNLNFIKNNKLYFDESVVKNEDGIFNLCFVLACRNYYITNYDGYLYRQWKQRIKYDLFEPDDGLAEATQRLYTFEDSFKEFDCQMYRREVSVVFWNAIKIGKCRGGIVKNIKRLKKYIDDSSFEQGYVMLDFDKVSVFKKLLVGLLYKKRYFWFYIIIKYIVPIFKR